jgi:hypothetical protein
MIITNIFILLYYLAFPNKDYLEICEMEKGYTFSHVEGKNIICKKVKND